MRGRTIQRRAVALAWRAGICLLAAAGLVAAMAGRAAASPAGALSGRVDTSYTAARERDDVATAGASLRLLISGRYAGGLDLRLGGAMAGFAYEAMLWPVGIGMRRGHWLDTGILLGSGISGVTGAMELAVPLAAEVYADAQVGGRLRLGAVARVAWLALAPSRSGASLAGTGADELFAGVSARYGAPIREYNSTAGRGLVLAAGYQRALGTNAVIVSIGYGLHVGWEATPAPFPGALR